MRFSVLDDAQLQRIHDASCHLLATLGVQIPHEDMRRRFAEAGAKVDDAAEMVRIPEALIENSLASAGKTFTTCGRDLSKTAAFGVGKRNYNTIAGEASWIDDVTGERRWATLEDVATAARFGDALPHLTICGAMSDPHELPPSYRCVEVAATLLRNTTKPIGLWYHDRASAAYLNELYIALRGSEVEATRHPPTYPFLEPISPLRFPRNGVDLLYETARLNLPVPIGPMCQAGMSGPVTLAGTLAIENAEILAGVCITQLIRPGIPVCYGGIPHAFDMRTTQMIFCGPEQALMAVAMTQLGKRYGLPVYINVGLTDSKVPDAQAGIEAGITLAAGALAGADIFGHMGICGVDQASSLDILLVQHELMGYVERVMRGLGVNDETLALDAIAEVGPGGTFMDHDHTAAHFREEIWFPRLLDRQFYDPWVAGGKLTFADRARAEKQRILREHTVAPLPEELEREFTRICAAAKKHLGG
jgi:trimethylamine--corrinoid protein Co-methyltransferase